MIPVHFIKIWTSYSYTSWLYACHSHELCNYDSSVLKKKGDREGQNLSLLFAFTPFLSFFSSPLLCLFFKSFFFSLLIQIFDAIFFIFASCLLVVYDDHCKSWMHITHITKYALAREISWTSTLSCSWDAKAWQRTKKLFAFVCAQIDWCQHCIYGVHLQYFYS